MNRLTEAEITSARETPILEVWDRLGLPPIGKPGLAVCSPFREDLNPSLSVGGRKNIVFDFGTNERWDTIDLVMKVRECSFQEAVGFVLEKPVEDFISNGQLTKPRKSKASKGSVNSKSRKVVDSYSYRDENGEILYIVDRCKPKAFSQRRSDGKGGWIPNVKNVRRVLYRFPDNIEAIRRGETVFVCEGEKDCESLARLGVCGTCNPGGAGKWRADYSETLRGAKVVILPDNDPPGREHGEEVARSLCGIAESVKVLSLPDLSPKGDVTDWIKKGGTREELLRLAEEVEEWRPSPDQVSKNSEIHPSPELITAKQLLDLDIPIPREIVQDLLVPGVVILAGPPKSGKSWLALLLALCVTCGTDFLGRKVKRESCLYLALEDSLFRLQSRIHQIISPDIDPIDGLHITTEWPPLDNGGETFLREFLEKTPDCSLVIVDVLAKVRPATRQGCSWYEQDYRFIQSLREVAKRFGICLLLIHHTRKSTATDGDPFESVSGSLGLTGCADTIMVLKSKSDRSTLYVRGRDVDYQEIPLHFEEGMWGILNDPQRDEKTNIQKKIIEFLEGQNGPCTPKEIAQCTGVVDSTVRQSCSRLANRGEIEKAGRGLYQATNSKAEHPMESDGIEEDDPR